MSAEAKPAVAVALHYQKPSAPRVVAKGRGVVGQNIIEAARQHGVPIEQNPALAEALSQVELGYAYPFISLSYVLILIASKALFGEELSAMKLFGVASICLGVLVIAGGQ